MSAKKCKLCTLRGNSSKSSSPHKISEEVSRGYMSFLFSIALPLRTVGPVGALDIILRYVSLLVV